MTTPLVSIRDLHVELGGRSVLDGVDAELKRGQITALIGWNGSGKTTLLRALVKEVPYRGRIEFHCGHDHRRPTPEHVGYVPQKLRVEANLPLTVADLLGLALLRWWPLFLGIGRRARQRMEQLLARVWLGSEFLDRPVEKLSGGELQRVLLALALEPHPELLLLDEPAAGIDFQHAEKFYELLADLNRRTGVTILLVSHELSVVNRHAHHVLCLTDGRVQCQGPPQEMLTQDAILRTFGSGSGLYGHHHD
ncbi:MAG: metal ABC transporter ATP-binding protein [Planctomycetes bacterium]|nr:metal ABC transporter ATP-binding protein [Planctomycetota bacterium]